MCNSGGPGFCDPTARALRLKALRPVMQNPRKNEEKISSLFPKKLKRAYSKYALVSMNGTEAYS
jgi:hypothetical protein